MTDAPIDRWCLGADERWKTDSSSEVDDYWKGNYWSGENDEELYDSALDLSENTYRTLNQSDFDNLMKSTTNAKQNNAKPAMTESIFDDHLSTCSIEPIWSRPNLGQQEPVWLKPIGQSIIETDKPEFNMFYHLNKEKNI